MSRRWPKRERAARRRDGGAVLVVVMLVMLGLLGMGITALWLTSGSIQISANTSLRNQALYVAEAGIERAREVLNGPIPPNMATLLAGSSPGQDDVPTAVDPETGLPNGVGAILIDTAGVPLRDVNYPPPSFNRGAGEPGAPTAQTMGTYTVWIRNDTSECRQGLFTNDTNTAVVVRSRGLAPDGKTQVVLEVTLGPPAAAGDTPPITGLPIPVLCNAGKNACEDNNNTINGMVVAAP